MFMVSWPFWTGCTKDLAGTTISVVVFMIWTSTVLAFEVSRFRDGWGLGWMSSLAIFEFDLSLYLKNQLNVSRDNNGVLEAIMSKT